VTDAADDQRHPAAKPTPLLVESIGGWRGLVDSGLPVVVFVGVNALAGLRAAVWAAIGAGVVLCAIRLARKETVQQALSGFFGVLVAAFIANRTGEAKGFFLLGIWASFAYAGVFLVSVLARWPLVGLIWEYVDGRGVGTAWRKDRALMRVYTWCTLLWVLVFLARALVQRYLYDQDSTGWLAFARLAMGYPFTIGALAVSVLAVRRVRKAEEAQEAETDPVADVPVRPEG
jgi:intracellular septation protein A